MVFGGDDIVLNDVLGALGGLGGALIGVGGFERWCLRHFCGVGAF